MDIVSLAKWTVGLPDIVGVTISGGEPMEQAEALCRLIDLVRRSRDLPFWLYTGYTYEDLLKTGTPEQRDLLSRLDVVVDGAYVRERHTDLKWRGSDNQRVIFLTDRHADLKAQVGERGNGLEMVFDGDGFYLVGIPPMGFVAELKEKLQDLTIPPQH